MSESLFFFFGFTRRDDWSRETDLCRERRGSMPSATASIDAADETRYDHLARFSLRKRFCCELREGGSGQEHAGGRWDVDQSHVEGLVRLVLDVQVSCKQTQLGENENAWRSVPTSVLLGLNSL